MKRNLVPQLALILIIVSFLTACGSNEEPEFPLGSPTLVIPTAIGGEEETPVAGGTNVPNPTISVDTPTPTNGSFEETSEDQNQSAPLPTRTVRATPTVNPLVQIVTIETLPAASRSLLFVADGSLKRWSQGSAVQVLLNGGQDNSEELERGVEQPIIGDITSFTVSDNGRSAVAARLSHTRPLTDEVGAAYELIWLNLDDASTRVLVPQAIGVESLALSGDGQNLLFIASGINEAQETQSAYLVNVGNSSLRAVGQCEGRCRPELHWHPDNSIVVWGDGVGLQLFNIAASEKEVWLATYEVDAESLIPVGWANNGRYLLMWRLTEVRSERIVFDIPTGGLVAVPDSGVEDWPFVTEIDWMPDARLLVLRPGFNEAPTIELWRPRPEAGEIDREEVLTLAATGYAIGSLYMENGRFAYVLIDENNEAASGLYHLVSLAEDPQKISVMTPLSFAPEVAWSPDGFGAILRHPEDNLFFYGRTDGAILYDLQPALGQFAHSFHWLPPRSN